MKLKSWQSSVLIGAAIGLAVSMFNREERENFKSGSKKTYNQIKHIYSHPSDSIRQLRLKLDQVSKGTDKLLEQIDQVERLIDKVDQGQDKQ
ncbi:YtxH domain-containing protein [Piscibacillus sp. B03]|uniref:YtxH domain-containing protein n=1 Tax=Piscibacillus sp. B03 TaxID=3457430 RepID=UPI003FCE130B